MKPTGPYLLDPKPPRRAPVELRAVVRGYVQGVGFRAFVRRRALALGLAGYVRNTAEGDVEVLAQGAAPELDTLLADLQRGPSEAEVSSVDHRWAQPEDLYRGFEITY